MMTIKDKKQLERLIWIIAVVDVIIFAVFKELGVVSSWFWVFVPVYILIIGYAITYLILFGMTKLLK